MSFAHLFTAEARAFVRQHAADDVRALALRAPRVAHLPALLHQIRARQLMADKLPTWVAHPDVVFPATLSLEQCSSEATARHKTRLVAGHTLTDLTGGFGVDAYWLAQRFDRVTYLEANAKLAAVAVHNFAALGATNITCVVSTAEDYLADATTPVDCFYLDPARRNATLSRVTRLADCAPALPALLPTLLARAPQVLLKASPMLDLALARAELATAPACATTVLAVDNEVKEVLFRLTASGEWRNNEPLESEWPMDGADWREATNLTSAGTATFAFDYAQERAAVSSCGPLRAYLYEPNAAVLKAGAFKLTGQRFGLDKLHPHTHLYTAEARVPDFPGRVFRVQGAVKLDRKTLLARLPGGKANLAVRNFPLTVAQIRQQTGLGEGGTDYLFAVTDWQGARTVVLTTRA